jgi:hypothetical protein
MRFALSLALLAAAVPALAQTDADFARAVEAIRAATAKPVKLAPRTLALPPAATPVVNRSVDLVARFPQLRACENTAAHANNYYGAWSLWLLTDAAAYYYHEDCDICAAVDSCDMRTGRMTEWRTAHSVDCSAAAPLKQGRTVLVDCR